MNQDSSPQSNNGSTTSTAPVISSENLPARAPDGKLLPGGPSLNPHGRPKGVSITDAIKRKLEEKFPKRECFCSCHSKESDTGDCIDCKDFHEAQKNYADQKTYLEALIESILENAVVKKRGSAQDKVWAYIDGLPKGSLEIGVDRESLAEIGTLLKELAKPKIS